MTVSFQGPRFRDAAGRQLILRGVNLGGDCKVPWPNGGTDRPSDFSDHRTVSFVGRPFPMEEADEHLGRLAHWGFNTLRLLTTWEAVAHAGPDDFDQAYLDYFAQVCRKAGEHGLMVFVDFHQDVWSRMSGGDGGPGWTFEAVGLDFRAFAASGAAHVMQAAYDYASPERRQAAYPQMSWGGNYRMPANAVMWTLFWAGRQVTPLFHVGGQQVQAFLQGQYLAAMRAVAERVAHMPHVIGFDTLNEPGTGWIGQTLSRPVETPAASRPGPQWSPLDALAVARGVPVDLPVLGRGADGRLAETGVQRINPDRVSAWLPHCADAFEAAGIWSVEDGRAVARDEDAFARIDMGQAYGDFFSKVAETIRAVRPDWLVFAELDPFGAMTGHGFPQTLPEGTVNASHWYDLKTLVTKTYDMSREPAATRAWYAGQLARWTQMSERFGPGGAPTLIGEFGIPYDLDGGEAYAAWDRGERDVWAKHERALSLMYDAMDQLQLSSTQWNYTASNRNDLRVGDGWNQEDLSIFSRDQQDDVDDPDSGGRALDGFCRPYVRAAQGDLVFMRFEDGVFEAEVAADPYVPLPTEVYVPARRYPGGFDVDADGDIAREGQLVQVRARSPGSLHIRITPR